MLPEVNESFAVTTIKSSKTPSEVNTSHSDVGSAIADNKDNYSHLVNYSNKCNNSSIAKHNTKYNCKESITHLNRRYLGDSLSAALAYHKFIIVQSAMGSGKTSSMKEAFKNLKPDDCACIQAPRTKLLKATASELGFSFYEDLKKEGDKKKRSKMARRLCVTPQSAPALFEEFPDIKYKLFVIDESETQAGMLVSSATKNKEKALDALKVVSKKADHVILMDAHASEKTDSLMMIMCDGEPVHRVINSFSPWSNIKAEILEGANYSKRRLSIDALQFEALRNNKKIAIASSSKKYCQERSSAIEKLFPQLKVLLITGDNTSNTQEVLNNTDSLKNWDVVIFSPAVSVGVSFDIENHVNEVFGVFPNTQYTGDTDDAIQSLARIRKPINQKWTICLDDEKNIFSNSPACPNDIANALGQRHHQIAIGLKDTQGANDVELQLYELFSVCQYQETHSKNNFNKSFKARLRSMGVTINALEHSEIEENELSNDTTSEVKHEAIEKSFIDRTESPRITEEEARAVMSKQKYKPWELLENELESLARFKAERDLMINFDDLDDNEKREAVDLLDNGVVSKCINREIALDDSDFTREYMKARKYGLGEKQAFKADVLNDAFNYPLRKKLLSYAVPYFDGLEYSHDSLKRGALVQFVARHKNQISALRVATLPSKWKSKPALLMNYLLELCGFEHTSSRTSNKDARIFRAVRVGTIDRLVSKRKVNSKNWVDATRLLMNIYIDGGDVITGGASLDDEIKELSKSDYLNSDSIGCKIDSESQNHFYKHLAKIPVNNRKAVIDNYILTATAKKPEGQNFSSIALANLSMFDAVKTHSNTAQNRGLKSG